MGRLIHHEIDLFQGRSHQGDGCSPQKDWPYQELFEVASNSSSPRARSPKKAYALRGAPPATLVPSLSPRAMGPLSQVLTEVHRLNKQQHDLREEMKNLTQQLEHKDQQMMEVGQAWTWVARSRSVGEPALTFRHGRQLHHRWP